MANSSQKKQSGTVDPTKARELITFATRLAYFVITLVPLGALVMPWVTLDGTEESLTGVETVAVLTAPIGSYLYEVSTLQTATLTIGTALIALMAMLTAYYYHKRKSIYWAPCAMLVLVAAIYFGTGELVEATHAGPSVVITISILLIIHQALIRVQVALRRKEKLPKVYRTLAVVAGSGYYRWRET